MHFNKSDYEALTEQQKRELKSAFLWSGSGKCWVSRAKEPNLYHSKQIAKKFGFTEEERKGERLSYAEQLDRQAERAEERADKYDQYAANAASRGEQLQKPINRMHGDIAFFTQPNLNSSAGRAFTNKREHMFNQYHKGFDEYRKSDYFNDKAQTARTTAAASKFKDKVYLDRQIKECKKEIKNREKNVINYENTLTAIENGEEKKRYNGEPYTAEEVNDWIEREIELIEKAIDKQAFLENCLDELGGVEFNKENIKVGYVVWLDRGIEAEVMSAGPQNINYKILTGGSAGMVLKAAYAEIKEVIRAEEKRDTHPFKVGEQFKAVRYNYEKDSFKSTKSEVLYEIVKASNTTIQLQAIGTNEKPITRKPAKRWNDTWMFSVDDRYGNTFYKSPKSISNEQISPKPSILGGLETAKEGVTQNDKQAAKTVKKHETEL